jgi:hypothetical protein
MPTVLKIRGFRFHFYSDEGKEPPHIHVTESDGECKYWLEPVKLANNRGIKPNTLRVIEKLVFENKNYLLEKYNEFHKR